MRHLRALYLDPCHHQPRHGCHGLICPLSSFCLSAPLCASFSTDQQLPLDSIKYERKMRQCEQWKNPAGLLWQSMDRPFATFPYDVMAKLDFVTELVLFSPRSQSNAERPRGSRSTVCIVHCNVGEWMKTQSRNDMAETSGSLVLIALRRKTKSTVLGMNEAKLVLVML